MTPRTPQRGKQPPFDALRAFLEKGGGHARWNPWIYAIWLYKPLIREGTHPASLSDLSTGSARFSTGCDVLPTDALFTNQPYISLYLSIYKEERREEEGGLACAAHPRVGTSAYFLIHGLAQASTGFSWMNATAKSLILNLITKHILLSTYPQFVLRLVTPALSMKGSK
jgi:hypothetical protein